MKRLVVAMLSVSCLVASLLVASTVPNASAAADPQVPGDPSIPVTAGTTLPFDGSRSSGDIVVDEAHGHVFVSGGEGTTGVVVVDRNGQIVETIPDLAGAEGMLLSEDGTTLYVALVDGKAVAAIDTETLVARTFAAGDRCPRHLAQVGAHLYFTEACPNWHYRLMRLDPLTGVIDPVTLTGESDQHFRDYAPITAHPTQPGRIFIADNEYRGGAPAHAVSAFEVDGLTANRVATRVVFVRHVNGLDFPDDGQELVVASGDDLTALAPSDLSVIRDRYPQPTCCTTFSVAASTEHVASNRTNTIGGDTRIVIHDRAGEYVRAYLFDAATYVGRNGVELAGDRVFAMTSHDDGTIRLHALTDVATPGPLMGLFGTSTSDVGEPMRYDGWATLVGRPFAGRELEVWRSGADGLVALPPIMTASDGTFAFDDTVSRPGNYRYIVISPAAPGLAADKTTELHTFQRVRTVISLEDPGVISSGEPVVMRGRLVRSTAQTPVAGATVTATHTHGAETTALPPVVTDSDGRFSFEVSDPATGKHTFDVTYAGDATYTPDSDWGYFWVKQEVVVELSGPDAPYLMQGEWVTLRGRLTAAGGEPVPHQTVHWERRRAESASADAYGSAVTDANGGFWVQDYAGCCGETRWIVRYFGDDTHKDGTNEAAAPVYERRPEATVTTNRTRYDYNTDATVSVRLPDDASGRARVFMEPSGQEPRLVADNPLVDGPDGIVTLRLTRNTVITADFQPTSESYTYAPHSASVVVPVVPVMGQTLSRWHAKDGRVHLVRTRVDPALKLATRPPLTGKCVRVRVERFRNGAYRFVKRSTCVRLDQYSTAKWPFRGDPAAGARFRLRYEWAGSSAYSARDAAWSYLRFTR